MAKTPLQQRQARRHNKSITPGPYFSASNSKHSSYRSNPRRSSNSPKDNFSTRGATMGCSSLLRSLSFPRPSCAPSFDSKHGKQPMSRKTRICSTTTTRNGVFHRTLSTTAPIRRNRRINRFGGIKLGPNSRYSDHVDVI